MGKVLVKWEGNWADEIDLVGAGVVESWQWRIMQKAIEASKEESIEIYVGGNMGGIPFSDCKFEANELSDEEFETLEKLGLSSGYGINPLEALNNELEDTDYWRVVLFESSIGEKGMMIMTADNLRDIEIDSDFMELNEIGGLLIYQDFDWKEIIEDEDEEFEVHERKVYSNY